MNFKESGTQNDRDLDAPSPGPPRPAGAQLWRRIAEGSAPPAAFGDANNDTLSTWMASSNPSDAACVSLCASIFNQERKTRLENKMKNQKKHNTAETEGERRRRSKGERKTTRGTYATEKGEQICIRCGSLQIQVAKLTENSQTKCLKLFIKIHWFV